jgi:hypothetical protein
MRSLVVAACIGLVALAGCTPGRSPINPPSSSGATAAPPTVSVQPTPESTSDAPSSALLLAPGKAGPFTIGMTSDQALKDGLVREPGDSECGLTPVGSYREFSVQFADAETGDVLFGVLIKNKEAKTAEGIGVGDSITQLKKAYGAKLKPFKQAKRTVAYRLGNLIFTVHGAKIGVVGLGRDTASVYVALNAPTCS